MAQSILKIIALAFTCTMCTKLRSGQVLEVTFDPEAETKLKKQVIIACLHTTIGIPKKCIKNAIFPYLETTGLKPQHILYSLVNLFDLQWFLTQDKEGTIVAHDKTGIFKFTINSLIATVQNTDSDARGTSSGLSPKAPYDNMHLLYIPKQDLQKLRTTDQQLEQLRPWVEASIIIKIRTSIIE